jgi:phosphatidylglycerol---prolipoprotein diacylglyceryl transferase
MPAVPLSAVLYGWMMLAGVIVSILLWAPRMRADNRLVTLYLMALAGAFLGAKLVYLAAEGWMHIGTAGMWMHLVTGKSIIGALLGGYLAVELTKRGIGYTAVTGDLFAAVVPIGVAIGRVGCWFAGCCLGRETEPHWWTLDDVHGISRWPSVPMEFAFNLLAALAFTLMRRRGLLPGQHFHLYLIAYGGFRFLHEFMRDTPRVVAGLSGYQLAAVLVMVVGIVGYARRAGRHGWSDAVRLVRV